MQTPEVQQLVGHLFRHEAGKMAAVLTRLLGFQALDLTEDIIQDTLLQAMSTWKIKGVPENPSAWLYTVAKRKAIDIIREQQVHKKHHLEISQALQSEWVLTPTVNHLFLTHEIEDSQLRMIFACCHPSIPYESQLVFILKTLCGLSVAEIARSFMTNDETISKRIYRAREKIREEEISLESPAPAAITGRLDAVLHSLYLLFNEGYNSSHPDQLIRHDLCEEAMRLCLLLTNNTITNAPKVRALLSLMCFQASRADARIKDDGSIVLLKDQERSQWNKSLIEKGKYYLELAADGEDLSEYHLEAAIAGCHSEVGSFNQTDWNKILMLYEILSKMKSNPVVELNKAIATGYALSPQEGLKALAKIESLQQHYLYHAAKGDFYQLLPDVENTKISYQKALELALSPVEKRLLQLKLTSVSNA